MKNNIFKIAVICFMIVGCNFSSSTINQESDKAEGEKVANSLYGLLIEDKYGEVEEMFGEEFFAVVSKEKLSPLFTKRERFWVSLKVISW